MTRNEAVRILIHHAARDVAGTGTGIRSSVLDEDRTRVKEAVCKLYTQAFGYQVDDSALLNLGLLY